MDEPESGPPAPELQSPLASPRKSKWPWVVLLLLLFLGLGFLWPALNSGHDPYHRRTEAAMNLKQIGLALFVFQKDYGQYPCEDTIKLLKKDVPDSTVPLGDQSANQLLRQLFVAGSLDRESVFHVPGFLVRQPDNIVDGSRLLEAGECGVAYVVWEGSEELPPSAPLLLSPVLPGQKRFDPAVIKRFFGRKVIILHADLSLSLHSIDGDGRIIMSNGSDFFDWSQPHWGGQKPRIAWPE